MPPRSFVDTVHGPLAYRRSGQGSPVVLIHGSLVTADDMFLALESKLSGQFDIVAFDRPGHGASVQTRSQQGSTHAQAEMLAEGWGALGMAKPLIVGHSFGGAVGLSAAISLPDAVRGVVALAPICFPEPRLEQLLFGWRAGSLPGALAAAVQGRAVDAITLPLLRNAMFLPQVMPEKFAAEFPFEWASGASMMIANGKDSLAAWRALSLNCYGYRACLTPVRIIGGTMDVVVNNATHGFTAASLLPKASFEWVLGAGHMVHHFHQATVAQALHDLLACS